MPRYLTALQTLRIIKNRINTCANSLKQLLTSKEFVDLDFNLNDLSKIKNAHPIELEPLLIYACRKNKESAKVLLQHASLNLNATNQKGQTALFVALTADSIDVSRSLVDLLLQKMYAMNILIGDKEFSALELRSSTCNKSAEILLKMRNHNNAITAETVDTLLMFNKRQKTSNNEDNCDRPNIFGKLKYGG